MPAAIQTTFPSSSGKFTATILSTHDLPEHAKLLTVQIECQMISIDDINNDPTMVMVKLVLLSLHIECPIQVSSGTNQLLNASA